MERLKTFAIFLLVVVAIYQTETLWFKDYSNRNFFYTFFTGEQISNSKHNLSVPNRIILNVGSMKYNVTYPSAKTEELENSISNLLASTFSSGQYIGDSVLDWNSILLTQSVIYDYSATVPTAEFVKSLGISNTSFADKVKSFQKIVIPVDFHNNINLSFVDTEHSAVYTYSIKSTSKILDAFTELQKNINNVYYSLSVKNGKIGDISFTDNLFIYQWTTDIMAFNKVNVQPENYDLTKMTDIYFDNTATKNYNIESDGTPVFSDPMTVVRYNLNGLFEYSNYKPTKSSQPSSVSAAYSMARAFLENDKAIGNSFTLHEIQPSKKNWTFCFDYTIDDFPVCLSTELQNSLKIKYAIEITANQEKVVKYKRYMVNITKTPEVFKTDIDFLKAIDKAVLMLKEPDNTEVQNVSLMYEINKKNVDLTWVLKMNSEDYKVKAFKCLE